MEIPFILPVTAWSDSSPTHRISCIRITPNTEKVVTSSYGGQLVIWDLDVSHLEITPRNILMGHEDPVNCMVCTNDYVISASEGGELRRWNLEDGYCFKVLKSPHIHENLQLFKRSHCNDELLFACGYYTEIFVIHPLTLQTIFILYSKADSDWISSFQVISSHEIRSDVVSGITKTGYIKLWIIEELNNELNFEVQSSLLPIKNAVNLKCNSTQTQLLIVSSKSWNIFDSKTLKPIFSEKVLTNETLLGGDFSNEDIVTWTNTGKFYMYQIDKIGDVLFKLFRVFTDKNDQKGLIDPAMTFLYTKKNQYLANGDFNGKINIWKVDIEANSEIKPLTVRLNEKWPKNKLGLFEVFMNYSSVTCCIYISEFDKFVVGCSDGTIISVPAVETIMYYYFNSSCAKPTYQTLMGHSGKVTCLLYPHKKYLYYNKAYLLSGGSDFSVCMWDLYKCQLIHRFCVHSGEIIKLIIPPNNCKNRIKNSICSVSSDHSVALLNLKERKCVILASRHKFPIVTINWKPLDDFIIVECFDGTVYVWQMETGHLDRIIEGVTAQEIVYACNESNELLGSNFYTNDKCIVGKDYVKKGIFHIDPYEDLNDSPFTIKGFLTDSFNESHLILFNIENLISEVGGLVENDFTDLTDPIMNQKIYSLTQHLNWDVQKKITGLLERIRGDKKIQESDLRKSLNVKEKTLMVLKFLLSSLHKWEINPEADEVLTNKLKITKPDQVINPGLASWNGVFSLFLTSNDSNVSSNYAAVTQIAYVALLDALDSSTNENQTDILPNLEILASLWQNRCHSIRNIVRKTVTNQLQQLKGETILKMLEYWYKYLPHFKILNKTSKTRYDFENRDIKTIALVLFGVVGSDLKFKMADEKSQESYVHQTCASFVHLLNLQDDQKTKFDDLQTVAIDLIGRGYVVWEPFLKIETVFLTLLDFCSEVYKITNNSVYEQIPPPLDKIMTAHNTLKAIAIARTEKFIACLINEMNKSTIDKSKTEIILIFNFLLEKSPYMMQEHLNDVIVILIYCIDPSHLKQDDLTLSIPVIKKFRQIHHSVYSQKIAVGLNSGTIVIHDLKSNKAHSISAHGDSITALAFSPDGKSLASYCCFENKLNIWQVFTGMFGLGQVHVKCVKTHQTNQLKDEEIRNHLEIASLNWQDNKSVMISLCDGSENVFNL